MIYQLITLLIAVSNINTKNTNMNGDIYYISNPNTSTLTQFSTIYSEQYHNNVEYFDVYSDPITSKYGEVYWTLMNPVSLSPNIKNRFHHKPMAIVGYEMDQVLLNGSSVPITWAYNHHYEAFLYGDTNLINIENHFNGNTNDRGANNHGYHSFFYINDTINSPYPSIQLFSEGNGGESRGSYHGYPSGYAQILYSPKTFRIQPMQIDTRNRDPNYINDTVFHPGILPNSIAAPHNASYSGLLECPCTSRIHKEIQRDYYTQLNGKCVKYVLDFAECQTEINKVVPGLLVHSINSDSDTIGCFFNQSGGYFNKAINGGLSCSNPKINYMGNVVSQTLNVGLVVNESVYLNITGPADVWFGIAFNATSMSDLPYSVIVLGDGSIEERKLANHDMGTQLPSSWNVLHQEVIGGRRSVLLKSDIHNANYDFSKSQNIPILFAYGKTGVFGYHSNRGANTLYLYSLDGDTCICYNSTSGTINGIPFHKNCAAEPIADLLEQQNPSCFLDTYQGGLSCCSHKTVLLDVNQTQPSDEMTYRIKFRFWFQEYKNHQNLIRPYFQTEAYSGEYDVPKCLPGTPPEEQVHSITARWKLRDMIDKKLIGNSSGMKFIFAGPHCHAPTCISMELYNGDTGDLLCRVVPEYGQGRENYKFDELDYIRVDPCIWGEDSGLMEPPYLNWDSKLVSIKKNNNSNAHYGEMASWQMRGIKI